MKNIMHTNVVKDGVKYHLVIKDGGNVGFYLFVYLGDNEKSISDDLQDTIEFAKSCAEDRFPGVKIIWQEY